MSFFVSHGDGGVRFMGEGFGQITSLVVFIGYLMRLCLELLRAIEPVRWGMLI